MFADQRLQTLFHPFRGGGRKAIDNGLAKGALLGDVFEQFLVVDLPVELAPRPAGDAAAARSCFAADGNGERRGNERRLWNRGPIALKTVPWRLRRVFCWEAQVGPQVGLGV